MRHSFGTRLLATRVFAFALALMGVSLTAGAPGAWAACGTIDRTWSPPGGQSGWNQAPAWSGSNIPDTAAENAILRSSSGTPNSNASVTVGCVDVQSGFLNTTTAITLTVVGDYFRNPAAGSLSVPTGSTWTLAFAGSAAQTFENNDTVNIVTITNNSSVTFSRAFNIRNALALSGTGTTLYVNGNLGLQDASTPFTIPASTTVEVGTGVTLTAMGGIIVNGTLRLNPGASLALGAGTTLQVNSAGLLALAGASGYVATVKGENNNTYSVNVAGALNANYFRVNNLAAAGLNITGTVQRLQNGEFHYLSASGYALTFGSSASLPATLPSIGFFNDGGYANVRNVNASAYTGATTSFTTWIGGVGGATYETDPGNLINWGAQDGTKLTVSDNTASGNPPSTIGQSVGPSYFATFSFSLTQADTPTDLTSVTLTNAGTASSSDIQYLQVFKDAAGGTSCVYEPGIDTQLNGNLSLTGSPPTATIGIAAGALTLSNTTPVCIHVLARTTATAQGGKTISLRIAATGDVSNSQNYSFSDTSGPPVSAGSSTIIGSPMSTWNGRQTTTWATANNWIEAVAPSATRDCKIGSGDKVTSLTVNGTCQNATLQTGGTLDFGGTASELAAYGSMAVNTGFTFTNATAGNLALRGAGSQSLQMLSDFPGNLLIANTGPVGDNVVSIDANSKINGSVTLSSGILRVNSGTTLTVLGNVSVGSGATLDIEAGGTLRLGNGSVLTVESGGTLELVGTGSQNAVISSTATTNAFTAVVNGTIKARYYSLSRLGATGLTISSGATIDPTYHLQDGSFSYPVPSGATFLRLYRQVPTDTMNDCSFDAGGSAATGITNVFTDPSIASDGANTLTLSSFAGTWAGSTYDNDSAAYALSWTAPTNTIDLTQESAGPASVNQGQSYTMGRFGFKQTQAGAFFQDTDLTSLKLTLQGTATSSDISQVRAYFDSDCNSSAGTLIGTGTFSGNPATVTFAIAAGAATIPASLTAPAKRCIYVVYDIGAEAVNGNTVGAKIHASTDVANSRGYEISGTTPPPVTLGTPASVVGTTTTWTGLLSNDWFSAGNWNGGVPTANLNCKIFSAANAPVISAPGAVCKSLTLGTGSLTLTNGAGATLDIYGSFASTGTFTQNDGVLRLRDDGATATNQSLGSSTALTSIAFNKTAGGSVSVDSANLTLNSFTLPAATSFEWRVPSGKTLILPNGATISGGTFNVQGGGTVRVGDTKLITVSGGTFRISGTNDVYAPESGLQALTNKGTITVSGSGRWGFNATSGTVNLVGFLLDYLDINGLRISGSTTLANLSGGQFTHLVQNWVTPVKALQLNTSGTVPATATNVGFMWDDANSYQAEAGWCNCAPAPASSYYLVYAPACGGAGISFDQWFGDFFVDRVQPDTETKIYDTDDGGSCQITMAASASPVSMMSLQAAGYDGAIAVDWVTGSELDHAGFNVYRADAPGTGLVQINRTLIRNFSSSVLGHGRYRFVDTRVENERPYFYYVEDVATNGRRTLHGPASATPRASAGPVPSSPGETNSDTSGSGGETGSDGTPSSGGITNGSRVDLGNGVHILAQTRRSLRLEIIPPAATLSPSAWNPAYKTLTLPGYSSTMEPGKPELAERTLLIEVDRDLLSATVSGSSLQETLPGTEMIAPAPAWAPDASGRLTPSWSIDPRAYESTSYGPSSYFELTPALETIGNRRYLRLKVMPFAFQPAPGLLKSAARIVLDLSFEAAAPPDLPTGLLPAELPLSPSAFENTLRIRIKRNGLHELTHEDLATLGLESAFSGADTSAFRLYYQGNELPLEIRSATGRFLPGDSLRFPALHRRSVGDAEDELVLSPFALPGSTGAPLRITPLNADPTGLPHSTEPGTWRSATAELDSYPMFDSPLGTLVDHLYWGRIFAEKDREPTAAASLTLPIELPALDVESPDPVRLRLYVKGGSGFAENPTHHLGIFVNHVPFIVAEASFASQEPQELRLEIPAAFFHAGSNRVRVQALADQVPDGDWDIVYVDRLDAEYRAHRTALDGLAEIQNYRLDHALTVGGFTDPFSIAAYDVTDVYQVRKLILPEPALETVSTHSVTFAASGGAGGLLGRRFTVLQDSAVLKPSALLLGRGSALPLNSSLQGADLLVVGSVPLLAAASELITAREAEGLRVVTVTPEQLYAEFSHGRRTAEALRGLIEFARAHWLPPAPRYLLILGDATYDPQNRLGFQTSPALMQMPLERGLYMDFGSDHWFVESGLSGLPGLAVGRIPTDDPDELLGYVRKLLDYESGARAPDSFSANRLVFVSDADTLGEGFASQSDALARSALASRAAFQTTRLDRQAAGSDGALRSAILDTFEQGPLAITYLGHGAEDRWAGPEVFANADADALAHSRLPIVVALNCLNGYFYDADPAFHGLGEKLLLNPDGGAIAFWGSTAMTLPTAQVSLARAFLDRLGHETRQSYHPARLGDLAVQAKTAVGFSPVTADALRSYTLLGDPTLRLPRSAFATAAPAPSPSISSGSGDDDGGIFGCGTVSTGGRGPGSSASGRGAAEFAIFIVLLCLARQLARRKSAIHPGWQR